MIVFSAFVPQSPLLLPEINKAQSQKLDTTRGAMDDLADLLTAADADTIVLISEHPTRYPETFSLNLSDPFRFDLKEFGHFSFHRTFHPDILLIDRLQRALRKAKQPVTLTTDEALHFASAVPLELLMKEQKDIRLVPVNFCDLPAKNHFQFGEVLRDTLQESSRRIAVIATGDLSHVLSSNGPAGFHPDGKTFDEKIQECLIQNNIAGLLTLDSDMIEHAKQTSYLPLVMLMGILQKFPLQTEILSYESPFGVGELVVHFSFS
jgi:aromatic ring-opening dioxygenase LigB subunit